MVRVLTVSSVRLSLQKSNPPTLLVEADGIVGTPGWKNVDLVPMEDPVSADGILDLEFVGTPPEGIVIQVVRPVTGDFVITKDVDRIVGVVVHARTNSMTQLRSTLPVPADLMALGRLDLGDQTAVIAGGFAGGPIPAGIPDALRGLRPPVKTLAIGEEGPTKFPFGETFTTFALGEEGKTLALGEEGKTLAFGEEGKTLAIGEEGKFPGQWGETPPLPWDVELRAGNKPPIAELQLGSTSPASDTAIGAAMHGMPFGSR